MDQYGEMIIVNKTKALTCKLSFVKVSFACVEEVYFLFLGVFHFLLRRIADGIAVGDCVREINAIFEIFPSTLNPVEVVRWSWALPRSVLE